jgi:GntR family transcriptional regulator
MMVHLNFNSGQPAYLQVVDQIKTAAASGSLKAGDALPPIRTLAEQLRLNRNTVAKAYAELESQGVIETLAGKGCFLTKNHSPFKWEVRRKMLVEEIDAVLVKAHHLQVEPDELLGLVKERITLLGQKNQAPSA